MLIIRSDQIRSVAQLCPTLCDPVNRSTTGLPFHHQLPEFTQTHVHWVSDAIQPSHPLLSPSPPAFNLPQHQGLFQGVSSSHQVAKVLEFQLQHQFFQWIFRNDFLCDPLDCSPPGSSAHGIIQARILKWVAMPSSKGSSQPRDRSPASCISCIAGGFFTTEPPGKPKQGVRGH